MKQQLTNNPYKQLQQRPEVKTVCINDEATHANRQLNLKIGSAQGSKIGSRQVNIASGGGPATDITNRVGSGQVNKVAADVSNKLVHNSNISNRVGSGQNRDASGQFNAGPGQNKVGVASGQINQPGYNYKSQQQSIKSLFNTKPNYNKGLQSFLASAKDRKSLK